MHLFTGHENGKPVRASIKLLLWLFASISTLVAVLVALLFFVDVNLYRAQIERHISTAFARDVVLEGPLSLEPSLTSLSDRREDLAAAASTCGDPTW